MTDLNPTVLREDAIVFRNDNFHINDDDCQRAADALDLLADLLDAIGDPARLREAGDRLRCYRVPVRGEQDARYLDRIAAATEGNRDH